MNCSHLFGLMALSLALAGCNSQVEESQPTSANFPPQSIPSTAGQQPVASATTMPLGELPPRSMAAFKNALLIACETQDASLLEKLSYADGLEVRHRESFQTLLNESKGRPVEAITEESLASLGKDFSLVGTFDGQRYEANLKHLGYIRVAFVTQRIGIDASGINFPYGTKDGAYYIVHSVRAK